MALHRSGCGSLTGCLGVGQHDNTTSSSTTNTIASTIVKIEQHCQAAATNEINITITQPEGCGGSANSGTDIIDPTINQNADATILKCDNESSVQALMNYAIKSNLQAKSVSQLPMESLAGIQLPTNLFQHNATTTNIINTTIETTDYSSLQACRAHAQNIVRIAVNDCEANRIVGSNKNGQSVNFAQNAVSQLNNCINNSTAMANMIGNIDNQGTSSSVTVSLWGQLVSTIGNIIMTCAIAAAICTAVVAIAGAITAAATAKTRAKILENAARIKEAELAQTQLGQTTSSAKK